MKESLNKLRQEAVWKIQKIFLDCKISILVAADIDEGSSPIIFADSDDEMTFTLDRIQYLNGKLSVDSSSAYSNDSSDIEDLSTDILIELVDWLEEHEERIRTFSEQNSLGVAVRTAVDNLMSEIYDKVLEFLNSHGFECEPGLDYPFVDGQGALPRILIRTFDRIHVVSDAPSVQVNVIYHDTDEDGNAVGEPDECSLMDLSLDEMCAICAALWPDLEF